MLADEPDAEENAVPYCVIFSELTRRGERPRSRQNFFDQHRTCDKPDPV
jgi:hypothetical protein